MIHIIGIVIVLWIVIGIVGYFLDKTPYTPNEDNGPDWDEMEG